jgi:hypothetical protein
MHYLQTLGGVVGRDTVKGFLPAVLQASKDPVPNCRFNASKALQVANLYPAESHPNFARYAYVRVTTALMLAFSNLLASSSLESMKHAFYRSDHTSHTASLIPESLHNLKRHLVARLLNVSVLSFFLRMSRSARKRWLFHF